MPWRNWGVRSPWITTDGPAGKFGFTASAVCSVTDSPPTLLVCMNRNSYANEHFKQNRALCVNVLSSDHGDLSGVSPTPACAPSSVSPMTHGR